MSRDEIEAFVDAIETHLGAARGAAHTLSPRDFTLARGWFEAGVPLVAVLSAIDRVGEKGPVVSLSACRALVEAMAPADPASVRRGEATVDTGLGGPYPEIQERLQRLQRTLLARDPAAAVLRRIEPLVELLSVATCPNAEHVRRELVEIDAVTAQMALAGCTEAQRAAWSAEAAGAVARQRGHLRDDALEAALRRHVEGRAREELQLPRVALL